MKSCTTLNTRSNSWKSFANKMKLLGYAGLIAGVLGTSSCGRKHTAEYEIAKEKVEQAEKAFDKAEKYDDAVKDVKDAQKELREAQEELKEAQEREQTTKKIVKNSTEEQTSKENKGWDKFK